MQDFHKLAVLNRVHVRFMGNYVFFKVDLINWLPSTIKKSFIMGQKTQFSNVCSRVYFLFLPMLSNIRLWVF
jgi:hypothetical protein